MARNWKWYAALHMLIALASVMEEVLLAHHRVNRLTGNLTDALAATLQIAHGLGALALGVLFDRVGPRASLLVSNLSYLGYEAVSSLDYFHFIGHVWRIMAHPSLSPWALALQECDADERASFIAHAWMTSTLARLTFNSGGAVIMSLVGRPMFCSLPVVSLALGYLVSRPVPDLASAGSNDSNGKRGMEAEATSIGKLAFGLGCTMLAPAAILLPTPAAMLSYGVQQRLRSILSRPGVCMAFLVLVVMHFTKDMNVWALLLATLDSSELHFSPEKTGRVSTIIDVIFFTTWAYLPGMFVKRAGPQAVIQILLVTRVVVIGATAVIYLAPFPSGLHLAQSMLLELTLILAKLASLGIDLICLVFLVGVVNPWERGTLVSLQHFGGIDRSVPLPLHFLASPLYNLGGVSLIWGLSSIINLTLLFLFRRSALMQIRLKEA